MRSKLRGKPDLRVIALLAVVAMLVVACGSNVSPEQQQAADIGEEMGGGLGTEAFPPGARVTKSGKVVNAQGEVIGTAEEFGLEEPSGGGAAAGTTGGGGSSVGGSGGASGGTGTAAPGVTAMKIYVGAAWSDAGEANRAFAGTSLDSDARKAYNAMIEEINKSGGIAGRKVEPIYHKFDASSSQTSDQQAQAACARWTQDNKVFAILGSDASGILQECAKKAGVIQPITEGASLPEEFEKYPHYIEISGMNLIRVAPVTIKGLSKLGYFQKGLRLGMVAWDEHNYRTMLEKGYLPALESRGVELATEPAYISSPQTFQDLGATSADVNSAVLRFQSQGITHVMILDGPSGLCAGACLGFEFLNRAKSQNYYPRYGFNDFNQPVVGQRSGLYPNDQLRRSVNVSWNDSDKSYDEGWKLNKRRELCYKIMRKHSVPMENTNQQFAARQACEQMWFLRTIIDDVMAGFPLGADNFIAGVNKLGWGFSSPSRYAVHYSPTQHDGTAAARNMRFVNSCDCYKYVTDPYRV